MAGYGESDLNPGFAVGAKGLTNYLNCITHQAIGICFKFRTRFRSYINPATGSIAINVGGVIIYGKGLADGDVVVNDLTSHNGLTVGRSSQR
jgi:hypothetical protein